MKRSLAILTMVLIPFLALADTSEAIEAYLTIMAIIVAYIICHAIFFFAYIIKGRKAMRICLLLSSLGLLGTGIFMFFTDDGFHTMETTAKVFSLLGLIGLGGVVGVRPKIEQ